MISRTSQAAAEGIALSNLPRTPEGLVDVEILLLDATDISSFLTSLPCLMIRVHGLVFPFPCQPLIYIFEFQTPLFLLSAQWLQNERLKRSGSRLVLCHQHKCFLSRLHIQAIKVDIANLSVSLKDHGDGGQASEQDSDCHPANIHQSPSRSSMRSGVCPSSQRSYLGAVQLRRTWQTEAGVPAERLVIPRTYTADWIISQLKDAQCMNQAQSGNAALTTSRVPAQLFNRASPGLD